MGGGKNSASGAEQTALNNMGQLNTQLLGNANQLQQNNSQYYQPLLSGLSQSYGNQANAVSPGLTQGLGTAVNSQGNMQGQTGVNANAGLQQLTGYASQPGATNLSGANQGLQQFYQGEMKNGIDPKYAQNAQNQLAQVSQQGLKTEIAHAAPGTNINALTQNNQSQFLQDSTNLQGNLAGQNQNIMSQGAAGVSNTAGGLDTQKLGMLQAGNTAGQQGNTQALQNLMSALGLGTQAQGNTNTFMQQGGMDVQAAMNALSGLSAQNATLANQFGAQAQQQQQGKNSGIGSLVGLGASAMTGGAAGAGGLGSILGNL